jgi:hypothetical protein
MDKLELRLTQAKVGAEGDEIDEEGFRPLKAMFTIMVLCTGCDSNLDYATYYENFLILPNEDYDDTTIYLMDKLKDL